MDTDSFRWPTHIVANLDAPFTVVSPPAFQQHLLALAAQLYDSDPSRGSRRPIKY